jgi:hypothetical protein
VKDLFEAPPPTPNNDAQRANVARYAHYRESEHCEEERTYLRGLWREFQALGLGDPDFLERFPMECGPRVWELRLATTFASWYWKLVPSPRPGHGPDFGIAREDGGTMWVEAVAPTAGDESVGGRPNQDKVRVPTRRIVHGAEVDRTIMLRYLGAIRDKRQKWAKWLTDGVVQSTDGYTIAISGEMVPDAWFEQEHEVPRIVRILFGVGGPLYGISSRRVAFAAQNTVRKSSGVEIDSRLFLDGDGAPELSAVLFSGSNLKERPERRGHPSGWDFVFTLNPNATIEFPFDAPPMGRVFFMGLQKDDRRRRRTP